MADPISVRNTIVQTTVVDKVQQVQQEQGNLQQQHAAMQHDNDIRKKAQEVQSSKESAEAKIKAKKEAEKKRQKRKKILLKLRLNEENRSDSDNQIDVADSDPGALIDIKV